MQGSQNRFSMRFRIPARHSHDVVETMICKCNKETGQKRGPEEIATIQQGVLCKGRAAASLSKTIRVGQTQGESRSGTGSSG